MPRSTVRVSAPVRRERWKPSSSACRCVNVERAMRRSEPSVTLAKRAFRIWPTPSAVARVAPYRSSSVAGVSAMVNCGSDSPSTACLNRKGTWMAMSLEPIIRANVAPTRKRSAGSA